jgi:hypothetical protein
MKQPSSKASTDAPVRAAAWEAKAVPEETYAAVARALASDESPVGIDAKHTHVLILHALERIESRLLKEVEGANGVSETREAPKEKSAEIRRQVQQVLSRAPAYAELNAKRRRSLADGLARSIQVVTDRPVAAVDFPGFVADLIAGTFEAIVDASVKQMEAYADLVKNVAATADEFASEAESEQGARERRQLLATMVLMGVSRIKVGKRGVRVRMILAPDDEDDD